MGRIIDVQEGQTEAEAKLDAADWAQGLKKSKPPPKQETADSESRVVDLRLDLVVSSPTNPRKKFLRLEELMESMRSTGQLEPIMVRYNSALGGHEIVHGERRFRACQMWSKQDGPQTIRAVIRVLSDLEMDDIRLAENIQRESLTPLEEAEGYRRMREVHKLSMSALSRRYGISKNSLHKRLQLLKLCPEARESLDAGEILMSVAVEVARLPGSTQPKALAALKGLNDRILEHHPEREGYTFLEARALIREQFSHSLESAPFDVADAGLVPGVGSCNKCPNRPEAEDGEGAADVCTAPECYREKLDAYHAAVREKGEAEGKKWLGPVLSRNVFGGGLEVSPIGQYVGLDAPSSEDPRRTWRELLGKSVPQVFMATNLRGHVQDVVEKTEALVRARALAAGGADDAAPENDEDGGAETAPRREDAGRGGESADFDLDAEVAGAVLAAAVKELEDGGARTLALLRMMIGFTLVDAVDEDVAARRGKSLQELKRGLKKMEMPGLLGLEFELRMSNYETTSDEMRALAQLMELNVRELRQQLTEAHNKALDVARAEGIFKK